MTKKELKEIDEIIQRQGDDFWNDPNDDGEGPNPNRGWVIVELLELLAKEGRDLKLL